MKCRFGKARISCERTVGCSSCPDYVEDNICPKCGNEMEPMHDVYVDVFGDIWDPDDDTANERLRCKCGHEEKVR